MDYGDVWWGNVGEERIVGGGVGGDDGVKVGCSLGGGGVEKF